MSTFQKIMNNSQRSVNRSVYQMNKIDIFPCHKQFCLCVEYLDFGKAKDWNKYKQCYITSVNNAKYNRGINIYNEKQYDSLYEFHKAMLNLDTEKIYGIA